MLLIFHFRYNVGELVFDRGSLCVYTSIVTVERNL